MNEDKYIAGEKIINNSNLWVEDKHLLLSIIQRARKLEKDVQLYAKYFEENSVEAMEKKLEPYYDEMARLYSEEE